MFGLDRIYRVDLKIETKRNVNIHISYYPSLISAYENIIYILKNLKKKLKNNEKDVQINVVIRSAESEEWFGVDDFYEFSADGSIEYVINELFDALSKEKFTVLK
ncbi:MAG: hypothetical protein QW046_04785 [Candidatus Micrarchaeaceae archaeon]